MGTVNLITLPEIALLAQGSVTRVGDGPLHADFPSTAKKSLASILTRDSKKVRHVWARKLRSVNDASHPRRVDHHLSGIRKSVRHLCDLVAFWAS